MFSSGITSCFGRSLHTFPKETNDLRLTNSLNDQKMNDIKMDKGALCSALVLHRALAEVFIRSLKKQTTYA